MLSTVKIYIGFSLVLLGFLGLVLIYNAEKNSAVENKVAREVLANGLIELTERVMALEEREGIPTEVPEDKK